LEDILTVACAVILLASPTMGTKNL
jgi:hypothetical protein